MPQNIRFVLLFLLLSLLFLPDASKLISFNWKSAVLYEKMTDKTEQEAENASDTAKTEKNEAEDFKLIRHTAQYPLIERNYNNCYLSPPPKFFIFYIDSTSEYICRLLSPPPENRLA